MIKIVSPMMLAVMLKEKRPAIANSVIINNLNLQHRLMVGRATNRSWVHGTHLPTTNRLDNVEEVKSDINKGKKDKEKKMKQVEETVDSYLHQFDQQPLFPPTKSK
ncbi:unnamed protein product [Amaranthus hypochondriacus]